MLDLISLSAEQTRDIGVRIGQALRAGDVVLLHGDLGAGKTTLAQGIARGLGILDSLQSPTFTLINEHQVPRQSEGTFRLYHLDLYRLDVGDLDEIGFDDYLAPIDGISLIEWPERAEARLPPSCLLIALRPEGEGRRRLTLQPVAPGGSAAGRWTPLFAELSGDAG